MNHIKGAVEVCIEVYTNELMGELRSKPVALRICSHPYRISRSVHFADHAFRSLIEYREALIAFILKAFIGLFILSIGNVVSILSFTETAIPGWANTLTLFNSLLMYSVFAALGFLLVHSTHVRGTTDDLLFTVVRGDERP